MQRQPTAETRPLCMFTRVFTRRVGSDSGDGFHPVPTPSISWLSGPQRYAARPTSAPGPGVRGGLGQPGRWSSGSSGLAGRTPPERAAARDTGLVVPVGEAAEDRARTGRRPKRRIRSRAAAPARGAGRARPVRSAPLTGGVANPRPGATSNPASTGACPPGNFLCDRRVATMPCRALLRLVTVRTVSDRGKAAGGALPCGREC